MTYETLLSYDEYTLECYYEGKEPKDLWSWISDEGE